MSHDMIHSQNSTHSHFTLAQVSSHLMALPFYLEAIAAMPVALPNTPHPGYMLSMHFELFLIHLLQVKKASSRLPANPSSRRIPSKSHVSAVRHASSSLASSLDSRTKAPAPKTSSAPQLKSTTPGGTGIPGPKASSRSILLP